MKFGCSIGSLAVASTSFSNFGLEPHPGPTRKCLLRTNTETHLAAFKWPSSSILGYWLDLVKISYWGSRRRWIGQRPSCVEKEMS